MLHRTIPTVASADQCTQTLTDLPRLMSTQECTEIVIFNKVLSGTLHGDAFGEDRGLQMQRIQFDFRVVRVQGRVRFQYSGDPSAVLKLKRLSKKQIFGELNLAEYARVSSPDEFTTVEFDFEPDVQNPFWQQGATGKVVSDFCSLWDAHFTWGCRDC